MRSFFAVSCALSILAGGFNPANGQAAAHPWSPELQIKTRIVASPKVSPDGKRVAYTVNDQASTDRTKAEHLQTWYAALDRLQPLVQKAARLPLSDKSAAILEAITIEEMLGERAPMGWLCPRRTAETPSSATPPRYLSDNAWHKYRQDLLEQLTRDALKDL